MITPYTYAVLSKHVYRNSSVELPSGWRVYQDFVGDSSYFGSAYINDSTGEIIIAHRGTEPDDLGDFLSDFQLALDGTPAQFTDYTIGFIQQVKAQMITDGLDVNKITYTGHSLGGVLAQMSSAYDFLQGADGKAVVFDSPGVTLQMLQDAIGSSFSNPAQLDLTNYVAAPDLVNTTNAHFADLVRVYPVFSPGDYSVSGTLLDDYVSYTQKQHDLLGIITAFNPTTGQPLASSHPTSWPSSGYTDFFLSPPRDGVSNPVPTFMSLGGKYSFRLNCNAANDNKKRLAKLAA